jgi:hypothetical protein
VSFAEQPPSKQWAALRHRGEVLAEVWFKPEDAPFALIFRIPQKSFAIPGVGQGLTLLNLLKGVAITPEEVEYWICGDASHTATENAVLELGQPLPQPAADAAHLILHVHLKPTVQAAVSSEGTGPEQRPSRWWQEIEARWKSILGLEATIDTLRLRMEGLRAELDAEAKRTLSTEEKTNALNADVAQWNKAKLRVHHVQPKVKEYIHRATWALGLPERKKLDELFQHQVRDRVPFPEMDKVPDQLDNLLKDRQVLSAHGNTVYQEGKAISAEVQGTLRTLQSNAAFNGQRKRGESLKSKSFK